jgi:uracil phosphoribosyltransferase
VGGSAIMAVEVLISRGVPEERILFLNLIASPEGIQNFAKKFPKLRVVTAFIDQVSDSLIVDIDLLLIRKQGLDEKK